VSAREDLLAAFEDIKALGALIDGEDTDDRARRHFMAAHRDAWAKARIAAGAYHVEAGGKAPMRRLTLEERRARVADVFAAGAAWAVEHDLPASEPEKRKKAAEAYAAGKVAK